MFDPRLERLAQDVRQAAKATALPVNLEQIAAFDDILLQPIAAHSDFNGKIEFLPDENVFVIFHPDPATYAYPARLRFSIAHELGHFYIDEHREALVRGESHSSAAPFRSKNPREVEADEFAAALLIPPGTMEGFIEKRGFLTLTEVCRTATNCQVSRYAAAIRYARMASEVCHVILAHRGVIKSYFGSDEAHLSGFGKINVDRLPATSPARDLAASSDIGEIKEQGHAIENWFDRSGRKRIWESCAFLGEGYTLSLLSLEEN